MVFNGYCAIDCFFKSENLMKNKNKNKNNKIIMLVVLVFIIPMVLSWVMYDYHKYFHFKTTNYGLLIKSPLVMPKTKKWQMIYISSQNCDQSCLKIKHNLNQIKIALGKNSLRVVVVFPDNQMEKKLSKLFYLRYQNKFTIVNKIYLVDPEGNIFMYYPSDVNPMNILKDLKHLLEVSQIG